MTDLAGKYRPKDCDEMEGGDVYGPAIEAALESNCHSFLLVGPSGTGKTTLARIIASMAGADEVMELDAASHGKVDDARELEKLASRSSFYATKRLIIVDECHAATKAAWQALLKAVEEPAEDVLWAFCTTESDKVPPTIKTRCATIRTRDLTDDELITIIDFVCKEEKYKTPDEVKDLCVTQAAGSARALLQNLSLVYKCKQRSEAAKVLSAPSAGREVRDFCYGLVNGTSLKKSLDCLHRIDIASPESFRLIVLKYVSQVIRSSSGDAVEHCIAILDAFSEPFRDSEGVAPIYRALGELFLDEEEQEK